MAEVEEVVAHDVPHGQDLEVGATDVDGVARARPVLGHLGAVQHRDVVELGRGVRTEEDHHLVAQERLDLRADCGHR